MSGIVGIYHLNGEAVERNDLTRMVDVIAHRGPDDSGVWIDAEAGIGLAHRRHFRCHRVGNALDPAGEPRLRGPDGRGCLDVHHEQTPAGAHVLYRDPSVRYHVAGTPQTIHGLPGNQQSIAFTPDGQQAWVLSTTPSPDST